MLSENTPENIKRLRQKIGLTQRECAEIFSMNPRTWRRKEEPAGTASGTALTPVEFKYLQLLAGEHPEYVLRKRDKPKCSE
ncbi:helix-turn-helix domain-containing protein [Escherichia coli]